MDRWLTVAGLLAVLLVAAVAFAAHGTVAGKKAVHVKGGEAVANVTLYVATRHVGITGKDIRLELTVDVVGRNATRFGRVVYGTGAVELGGVSYTAKSVAGFLGKSAAQLTIYTGNALIRIMYHSGRYYAVVKPLGTTVLQLYNGTAALTVS